ncbi:UNVERIFIED_CONTAM: creatinine amidohydrolase/Fe(II)-dependent formamide hydrolase-like protein [Acetivibrio alkalicellulosi]
MDRLFYYKDMIYSDLKKLDRNKTIFLWAISPIEIHGYHLPLDTDVIIAEELQKRYIKALTSKYPDFTLVVMPTLYAGAHSLPVDGSISVSTRTLEKIVYSYGKGLAVQGFKYLFISDNHGGPGHLLGIQCACEKLMRKYKFHAINPFGEVIRRMDIGGKEFLSKTNSITVEDSNDNDFHAGGNETSLMLVSDESKVIGDYKKIDPSLLPPVSGKSLIIKGISRFFWVLGLRETAGDLMHLSNTMAWVTDKDMLPYIGAPSLATKENGEAILSVNVKIAMELFEKVLDGKRVKIKPPLWALKFLIKFS